MFAKLDRMAPKGAVLASSSSSIVCSLFTEDLQGRHRCLIVHPTNPPYVVPILELVPSDDALLIEGRLAPNDIDIVAPGQLARVHLTPFASRHMPPLEGRLVHISADSTLDPATRESYYQVRVAVDPDALARIEAAIELTPGMPAEIYIVTGEQSLFDYLIQPVKRSFRRAFREA